MYLLIGFLILFSDTHGTVANADSLDKAMIVFFCEHGSAKSVVAAAHFNRLADQEGLPFHAVSRQSKKKYIKSWSSPKGAAADNICAYRFQSLPVVQNL